MVVSFILGAASILAALTIGALLIVRWTKSVERNNRAYGKDQWGPYSRIANEYSNRVTLEK